MFTPTASCRRLLRHCVRFPRSLAEASAGSNMAARMAIMAITTSNSIRVKPFARLDSTDLMFLFFMTGPRTIGSFWLNDSLRRQHSNSVLGLYDDQLMQHVNLMQASN